MKYFSTKLFILAILCRLYLTTAKSNEQSAAIISGSSAVVGQFPWHVIVVIENTKNSILVCGGSIVTQLWVLTAAHCIYNRRSVELKFGTIDLFNKDNTMNSSAFCIHPEFEDVSLKHDVGLIKLPKPLTFTKTISAIELVSDAEKLNSFIGAKTTISGFGRTQDANPRLSLWLLWTTLAIVNNVDCFAYHRYTLQTNLCAVGWNGTKQSPCHGDSGGALIWQNPAKKNVQIGIASFTKTNQCSQYPTGFVKVTSYLDYINNVIKERT